MSQGLAKGLISAVLLMFIVLFGGVEIGALLDMPKLDEALSGGGILGSLLAFYFHSGRGED